MARPHRIPDDPMEALRQLERRLDALERVRPAVPVFEDDPTSPQEGDVWINETLEQLCWLVNGVVRRATWW